MATRALPHGGAGLVRKRRGLGGTQAPALRGHAAGLAGKPRALCENRNDALDCRLGRTVPHSRIRELAEIAMSMDGVLRLYFGESNLPTPDYIKQAAIRAMQDGYTFYTENAGLPSLRRAIAESLPPAAWGGSRSGERDRGHGFGSAGPEPGNPLRARSGRPGDGADAGVAQRHSSVMMANAAVGQMPHPLCGRAATAWISTRSRPR